MQIPDFDNSDLAIIALSAIAIVMIIWEKIDNTILATIIGAIAGIAQGRKNNE